MVASYLGTYLGYFVKYRKHCVDIIPNRKTLRNVPTRPGPCLSSGSVNELQMVIRDETYAMDAGEPMLSGVRRGLESLVAVHQVIKRAIYGLSSSYVRVKVT